MATRPGRQGAGGAGLQSDRMYKIVVINAKGGSGKTTVAINLASYYAARAFRPALMDLDPQASATRWLSKRPENRAAIYGIPAFRRDLNVTASWQMRVPPAINRLIVDTPAAMEPLRMAEAVRGAEAILVPILPSDIDVHAATRTIRDLLTVGQVDRKRNNLAIIANRVRINTLSYQALMRFLESMDIPIVATLRDTQNYVQAADRGIGIHEMKTRLAREETEEWGSLIHWLEARRARALQESGDFRSATSAAP